MNPSAATASSSIGIGIGISIGIQYGPLLRLTPETSIKSNFSLSNSHEFILVLDADGIIVMDEIRIVRGGGGVGGVHG